MKDPIATLAGVLLERGIAGAEVAALTARLRRLELAGLAAVVDLPQYHVSVTLGQRVAARKHLHRPGRVE